MTIRTVLLTLKQRTNETINITWYLDYWVNLSKNKNGRQNFHVNRGKNKNKNRTTLYKQVRKGKKGKCRKYKNVISISE